jgi:hypothetical protein
MRTHGIVGSRPAALGRTIGPSSRLLKNLELGVFL